MTGERTESEGFFEMLWNCDHCGTKGLLGKSQRHCPECGAPQNPDKRYYPTPEQQQQVVGHAYEGADRTCPSCNAPMSAKGKNCTQCGSPLDGAKEVRSVDDRAPAPAPKRKRRWWIYILIGVVLLGFAIWFLFIRKREATVSVASHRWDCTVAIEEFQLAHESAWRDQVPPGAELPVCFAKQRSTRQIPDGETCHTERHDKKDGTFEQVKKCVPKYRSEPVDDQWCSFSIRKWVHVDEKKLAGTGTTPNCPSDGAPRDAPAVLGARRSLPPAQTLTLDFGSGGTCDVSDPVWRKYTDGQSVKVEVRARSGDVVCSSL